MRPALGQIHSLRRLPDAPMPVAPAPLTGRV